MFFKSYLFYIFLKFLWAGLFWGLINIGCKIVNFLCNKNVYVFNLISFLFCLGFGYHFILLCQEFYNFSFCWFGLLGMMVGLILVQISLNFLFTNMFIMLYNKFVSFKLRKVQNGKQRTI